MLREKTEVLKFFKDMEENIKMKIKNGGMYSRRREFSIDSKEGNLDMEEISGMHRVTSSSRLVRTMSSLDDEILKTLSKSGNRTLTFKNRIRTFSREETFKHDDKYSYGGCESPSFDGFYIAESKDELDRSRGALDYDVMSSSRRSPRSPGVPGSNRIACAIDWSSRKDSSPTSETFIRRRNSTGTIFIESTMSQQDNNATIKAVCAVIRQHMIEAARSTVDPGPEYSVFKDPPELSNFDSPASRSLNAQSKRDQGSNVIPSLQKVEEFFVNIFSKSQLEGECIIMALIYCERLVRKTKGRFCIRHDNWRSTLFACLVMASKVWDDLSMWNVDFSNILPTFTLQKINDLELKLLEELGFIIRVSAGEYAKYYFHLRSLMGKLGLQSYDEARSRVPLDVKGARKLQLSTEKYEALSHMEKGIPHSKSVHDCLNLTKGRSKFAGKSVDTHEFLSHHSVALEELVHPEHMDGDGAVHVSRTQSFNNSKEVNLARARFLEAEAKEARK